MSTAQQVRLWLAGAFQAIGMFLAIAVPTGDGPGYFYISNNGYAYEGVAFISLAAAATLGSISLYRFLHPLKKD